MKATTATVVVAGLLAGLIAACSGDQGSFPDGPLPVVDLQQPDLGPDQRAPDLAPDRGPDLPPPEASVADLAQVKPDLPQVSPATIWASAGTGGSSMGHDIATDSASNAYVTGTFSGTMTLGAHKLTSAAAATVFVARLDASGKYTWATAGSGAAYGAGVAVDAAGNVVVTGGFTGTLTLGKTTLTSNGSLDTFVAKLDAAGKVLWAISAGGAKQDNGHAVGLDVSGNVFVAGHYIAPMSIGGTALSGSHYSYVARLDTAGKVVWATSLPGTADNRGVNLAVDAKGYSHVVSTFKYAATIGALKLTAVGGQDPYVARVDPTGKVLWAVSGGSMFDDLGGGVAVDAAGNCTITGSFIGTASFGAKSISASGAADVFVVRLSSAGKVLWAAAAGSDLTDIARDVALDSAGNAYVAGSFMGTWSSSTSPISNKGKYDIVLVKLNPAGKVFWAIAAGGKASDSGTAVALGHQGSALLTGAFEGTAAFGSTSLTATNKQSVFVWRVLAK